MSRWTRAALGALFAGGMLLATAPGVEATTRLGTSPHGKADGCPACHQPGADGKPGAPRPATATCRECHPDADMHPVGVVPDKVPVAAGWPLEDGKLSCATCHAEPACDKGRTPTAPWFRGGAVERKSEFCYRCHQPQAMQRSNPHLATTAGQEDSCAACHTRRPEKGAAPARADLRVAPAESCATCHPGVVHSGVAEHLGKPQVAPLAPADAAALPLGADGSIQCWTCHDVHAAGGPGAPSADGVSGRIVAARGATLAASPSAAHPKLLALPAADGALCRACHGSGPR